MRAMNNQEAIMEKYKFGVFIGRFQPFHNSHLRAVQEASTQVEELIIIIGSANASRSVKNPFTFPERESMIRKTLQRELTEFKGVLHIVPARDYFYSDTTWAVQIQNIVHNITGNESNVCLIGNYKDASSYYINLFPQWELLQVSADHLNATKIREDYFNATTNYSSHLPEEVKEWLYKFFLLSDEFANLKEEFRMIQKYKESWSSSPFPPVFVTVDAVVISHGHLLVVRRKFTPGKGLLALPGGFIRSSERLEDACVRELREETGIRVPPSILRSFIKGSKVFDHPSRSTRGRTITHAYLFEIDRHGIDHPRHVGDLPEVKGGDDASQAMWIPLREVFEDGKFYEDHADIIGSFIGH